MQSFESIHLRSNLTYEIEPNGNARTVQFLGLVAFLILAIALINYINMTTARSIERVKEVGLRKTLGASQGHLFGQFLFEGFLLNGLALLLALVAFYVLLPFFGKIVNRPLVQQDFDVVFWAQAGALLLTGMLAACSYPAIALTRLAPIEALRGQTNSFFKVMSF